MKPELAILGGSFDPPHFGHVFLACYALSLRRTERVLVIPVYQHAFAKPLSPFEDRLQMCRLAFRDLQRVEVSDVERELGGVSRTLRLVDALEQRYPDHRLRTLVGSDILAERSRWQAFDEIARRAPLLVADRAGHTQADAASRLVLPEISSTAIRGALARGEHDVATVPQGVSDYARQQGLYRSETAP
jgi:nicotinate-nucleotide adenylyltransferase